MIYITCFNSNCGKINKVITRMINLHIYTLVIQFSRQSTCTNSSISSVAGFTLAMEATRMVYTNSSYTITVVCSYITFIDICKNIQ